MAEIREVQAEKELSGFSGSETFYRHDTMYLTEGTKCLAERFECFWLFDLIFSIPRGHRDRGLLQCVLTVNDDHSARFEAKYGPVVVFKRRIRYTSFPARSVEVWVQNRTIFLPSEY